MGVDEPRKDRPTSEVDPFGPFPYLRFQFLGSADRCDPIPLDKQRVEARMFEDRPAVQQHDRSVHRF
jgi:hypothetical protein